MQAKEIKDELNSLITQADTVDPSLARRLDEIVRWVKDLKDGSLSAKKFLLIFLLQVIKDAKAWLAVKSLSSEAEQELYFNQLTPTVRFWYQELFPKWLKENDPKFYIWRQKLMAGEFLQEDRDLIDAIAHHIERRQGTVVRRYIADLSMATDIIVSSREGKPLCIQLTTLSQEFDASKYQNWENTLREWGIDRGLFLSYNPGKIEFINYLVNLALYNSENLKIGGYLKFSL